MQWLHILVAQVASPGAAPMHVLDVDLVPVRSSTEAYILYVKDAHRNRSDDVTISMVSILTTYLALPSVPTSLQGSCFS
jgi:hypothetical protein